MKPKPLSEYSMEELKYLLKLKSRQMGATATLMIM